MTKSGQPARDPREELMECRNAIEVVDRRIVALLAQRVALSLRAAAAKRDAGLPIVDPGREADVIEHVLSAARDHGVPPGAAREIFDGILAMSRRLQEKAR